MYIFLSKCTKTFVLNIFVCELDFMDWIVWNIELSVWKELRVTIQWKVTQFHEKVAWKKLHDKVAWKSCPKKLHEKVAWKSCTKNVHEKVAWKSCMKQREVAWSNVFRNISPIN